MGVTAEYIRNHLNDDYWHILFNPRLKLCQKIRNNWTNRFLFSATRSIFDRHEYSIRVASYEKVKLKEIVYLMDDPFNGGHHVFMFHPFDKPGCIIEMHDVYNSIFPSLYKNELEASSFCNSSNNMLLYDIENLTSYIDMIIKLERYLI